MMEITNNEALKEVVWLRGLFERASMGDAEAYEQLLIRHTEYLWNYMAPIAVATMAPEPGEPRFYEKKIN